MLSATSAISISIFKNRVHQNDNLQGGASAPFLQLRPAEKTFLAMSGVLSNVRNGPPARPSCDNLAQVSSYPFIWDYNLRVKVPDSIEVVRNILSELEADAEDRPETEEEEDEVEEVEEVEECTCLQVSTRSRVEGSLVVDVHQGAVHRCSKHTAERFPRWGIIVDNDDNDIDIGACGWLWVSKKRCQLDISLEFPPPSLRARYIISSTLYHHFLHSAISILTRQNLSTNKLVYCHCTTKLWWSWEMFMM